MDHVMECDGYDLFTEGEAENILYSLVHHGHNQSDDLTEFNIGNEYSISKKNKALRWNSVQTFSDSSDPVGGLSRAIESNEILDYVPLDGSANTNSAVNNNNNKIMMRKNVRPNSAAVSSNSESFVKRDSRNNKRNKRNWNGHNGAKVPYIRNLVSVNLDERDFVMKPCVSPRNTSFMSIKNNSAQDNKNLQMKSSNQNLTFDSGVSKSNEKRDHVKREESNSVNSSIDVNCDFTDKKSNDATQKFQDDVIQIMKDETVESVQQSSSEDVIIVNVSNEINQSIPRVHIVGEHKVAPEILTLSDSDASNDSIIEVNLPPKPNPILIALDSSDETEKVASVVQSPRSNVLNHCKNIDKEAEIKLDLQLGNVVPAPQSVDNTVQIPNKSPNNISNGTISNTPEPVKKKKRSKKKKLSAYLEDSLTCAISMHQFYNQSWGGETFDHEKMQRAMTDNPSKWQILEVDKCGPLKNRGPFAKVRCLNCHQFGHFAKNCPDPFKIKSCFMCGMPGHNEFRCPYKICLKCGRPAPLYNSGCPLCWSKDHPPNCSTCGDKEHYSWMCPSVWRKLHSVTTAEGMNTVNSRVAVYKPCEDQSCCYCAKQGHNATHCPHLCKPYDSETNAFIDPSYSQSPRGKKRKKNRNSAFDWKWQNDFHRKRRKTN